MSNFWKVVTEEGDQFVTTRAHLIYADSVIAIDPLTLLIDDQEQDSDEVIVSAVKCDANGVEIR